jgi:hypothetical protein
MSSARPDLFSNILKSCSSLGSEASAIMALLAVWGFKTLQWCSPCSSWDKSVFITKQYSHLKCTGYSRLSRHQTYWNMKTRAFWDIVQCSLVEVCWRFRGAYYINHHSDDGNYTALYPRKL